MPFNIPFRFRVLSATSFKSPNCEARGKFSLIYSGGPKKNLKKIRKEVDLPCRVHTQWPYICIFWYMALYRS